MLKTIGSHQLIDEGDRILVAVSGGKDSYTLLDLLHDEVEQRAVRSLGRFLDWR